VYKQERHFRSVNIIIIGYFFLCTHNEIIILLKRVLGYYVNFAQNGYVHEDLPFRGGRISNAIRTRRRCNKS